MDFVSTLGDKLFLLKLFFNSFALIVLWVLVSACSGDLSNKYSITVEYLPIQLNELMPDHSTDYSSANVSIKRIDKNDSNEEVLVELTRSRFRHGKVEWRGQIEQPMWVEVLVETDNAAEALSTRSYIEPGERVALAVIDTGFPFYDMVGHVGTLSNVQEPSKKFTVKADLNSLNFDMLHGFAFFETRFWDEMGARRWRKHSVIVVQDGKFSVEVEVEDPEIFSAYLVGTPSYSSFASFVAEPGATILLEPSKLSADASSILTAGWFQDRQDSSQPSQNQELVVTGGTDRHARLIESWQNSFTYRLKQEQLDDARAEDEALIRELSAMRSSLEETDDGQSEESTSSLEEASWVKTDPALGCEHVDLSQVLPDYQAFSVFEAFSNVNNLHDEMDSIRLTKLNDVARRARDPLDSLLALELGAFGTTEQLQDRIKILEKLSHQASQTVVEKRVAPMLNLTLSVMESEKNERFTLPGQKAPDFELPDLRGNSRRFSQILNENALVLLGFVRNSEFYFVASTKKELHDAYSEAGLQIVEVLFDVSAERQQALASTQEAAWIQLLDQRIQSSSEIAQSYAVVHTHSEYLIDSNGCIVQRNINMDDLRGFLDSYFDIPTDKEQSEDISSP